MDRCSTGEMCTTTRLSAPILTWCEVQDVSDMYTHLLRNRIIFVGQRINDEVLIFHQTRAATLAH